MDRADLLTDAGATVIFVALYTGYVYWTDPGRVDPVFVVLSAFTFFLVYAGLSIALRSRRQD